MLYLPRAKSLIKLPWLWLPQTLRFAGGYPCCCEKCKCVCQYPDCDGVPGTLYSEYSITIGGFGHASDTCADCTFFNDVFSVTFRDELCVKTTPCASDTWCEWRYDLSTAVCDVVSIGLINKVQPAPLYEWWVYFYDSSYDFASPLTRWGLQVSPSSNRTCNLDDDFVHDNNVGQWPETLGCFPYIPLTCHVTAV